MGVFEKQGNVIVIVICIGELFIVGLLIFSNGFLLTRQVIEKNSTCEDYLDSQTEQTKNGTECWVPPTYKRAVIILIDALRYDFAAYNDSLTEDKFYLNKMPVFNRLVQSKPRQAVLLPFIADAPTTTMQRLKGLTTGSLPTFIDAGNNFASEEISEDNLIDQLVKCGKKVTIMGDDTWDGLFPRRFHRSFLYPSFNVMDLHTVDNGIISHLDEEMRRDDWDVIVAHFLGVDHCGHRYGPNHPEMEAKLKQMSDLVGNVAKKIDDDTILFVLGDHGMTRTGDHGGDSLEEITSALFVYSPMMNIPRQKFSSVSVAQVDFIPTVSLALGVPIPYSNLGTVLDNILVTVNNRQNGGMHQLRALVINVQQVHRYLKHYKELGNDFSEDAWQKLEVLSGQILNGFDEIDELLLSKKKQICVEYLSLAKIMCEDIWAKFSVLEMGGGMLIMATVLLLGGILIAGHVACNEKANIVQGILYMTIAINMFYVLSVYTKISGFGYVSSLVVVMFIYVNRNTFNKISIKVFSSESVSFVIILLMCIGSFSNSYVVVENYVVSYLLLSVVMVLAFSSFVKQNKSKSNAALSGKLIKWTSNYCGFICVSSLLVVSACVRAGSWFWKCREEQSWCTPSEIHTTMAGLPHTSRNWRYFTSLFSLILISWLPRQWLVMCGNMNGSKIGIFITKTIPVLCSILIAGHWALQAVPLSPNSPIKIYVVIPPLVTYALVLLSIIFIFIAPLMVYEVPPSRTEISSVSDNPYMCIPQLYHSLKAKYGTDGSKKQNIPIVYGLATALSAPMISVVTFVLMIVVLLAGDGLSPGILILMIATATCILVQAASAWMNAEKLGRTIKYVYLTCNFLLCTYCQNSWFHCVIINDSLIVSTLILSSEFGV
ncbi:hypothetical protein SK128_027756 [Halocaridina rubra]|uniref:GPI ethanolamine phosphate transferase 3, catalytic subunit n=1 Tax=Halocaridina rubra TaxID=373956 RepID=A0AAN8WX23_HALRR